MAQNRRPVRNYEDYYDDRRDVRNNARRQYSNRYDDRYDRRDDRRYTSQSRYPSDEYDYDYDYDRRNQDSRQSYGYQSDDYYRRRAYGDRQQDECSGDYDTRYRSMYSSQQRRRGVPPRKEKTGMGKKVAVVFIVLAFVVVNIVLFTTIARITKGDKREEAGSTVTGTDASAAITSQTDTASQTETQNTEPLPTEKSEEKIRAEKIEEILGGMSTEEKVGQLLLVRRNDMSEDEFKALIKKCHAGGVVLFKPDFTEKSKTQVKNYVAALQKSGGGKMLVCVDEEGGAVVRLSSLEALRTEKYMSPQQLYKLGGYDKIADDTVNKCEFLKGFGINVNFAPVSDVVTDPNAFLFGRAFGKDADKTAKYVSTVVAEMKANQVGSTLKHFPGYGNSLNDTHKGLDHNEKSLAALKSFDLVPFQEGIASGADSIMVTHTIIDDVDKKNPASLSEDCIAVIRDYLGFDGVVITDGLDMGAIIEFCGESDPCVKAVQAGCDLLCTPTNAEKSYKKLLSAVKKGSISEKRLNASVRRIIGWKIDLGLYDQ